MTKKQVFRSFVFLCGFIVVFSLLQFPYHATRSKAAGLYWQYFYQTMPSDSYDIVIMGDSHAQNSFMPEVIDEILNTQSVVLITPGSGIYQKYYEWKEIIKKQPDALIVMETNGIYGGLPQEDLRPWSYSFFDSMPFGMAKIDYLINHSSPANYLNYMFPLLTYHQEWKTPDAVLNKLLRASSEEKSPELPDAGYLGLLSPLASVDYERLAGKRLNPSSSECGVTDFPARFEVLEKMANMTLQKDGKFILMKAPVFLDGSIPCEDQLLAFTTEHGVDYSALLAEEMYSRLWFHDEVHTTTFGSLYVTLDAVPIMAEQLGREIDTEKYDYYRSYLFKELSVDTEGADVIVELIPQDELLSKYLLYQWEVKQNGEVIKRVNYQQEAFVNFPLTTDSLSDYEVHVWINHPAGEFVLEGIFALGQ